MPTESNRGAPRARCSTTAGAARRLPGEPVRPPVVSTATSRAAEAVEGAAPTGEHP